jgi:hypothetical protein
MVTAHGGRRSFKVTSANVDQQLFADLALENLNHHDLIPQPREGLF